MELARAANDLKKSGWGIAMKLTLIGALMLLVSGAASAQDFMISPDGNYVARHVLKTEPDFDRGILSKHRLEIISMECLERESTIGQCVVLSPSNFERKGSGHSFFERTSCANMFNMGETYPTGE